MAPICLKALAVSVLLPLAGNAFRGLRQLQVRNATAPKEARLPLLPYPASVQLTAAGAKPYKFHPNAEVVVGEGISQDDPAVLALKDLLSETGKGASAQSLAELGKAEGSITLRQKGEASKGSAEEQGYRLQITDEGVELEAPSSEGLFYGVQTLRQLVSREDSAVDVEVPAVTITDAPRFTWRGLHLDVSRHFFTATEVKRLLNVMSLFKLNRFHWHLTDDQGWRLPVEGYPKLTTVGGGGTAYTKEEIQDVVAYAQARHIDVIPEVDLPGHVQSALAAYPNLGNSDVEGWKAPEDVMQFWGISDYTLAPSNETFVFLGKVFDTLAELFPSEVVHMGGDEVRAGEWGKSAAALSFVKETTDLAEHRGNTGSKVALAFGSKLAELLKARGKVVAAWDEAQHTGSFPEDGIVVAWNSAGEVKKAVASGRRAVNADIMVLYFDHAQAMNDEPQSQGGCTSWQDVYKYDPMPQGLTEEQQKLVIGAQGQLWSEYFPKWEHVEYMAHPRSLALAETTWTPRAEIEGEEEFKGRLSTRLGDLDRLGINYRKATRPGCHT